MKNLISFLVILSFFAQSYAQESISISTGSAWWRHQAINTTALISEGQLLLYGGSIMIRTTKAFGTRQAAIPYLRYKVVGVANYDSVKGYAISLVYPPGNVSYVFSQSIKYLTPTGYAWNAAPPDTIAVSTSQLTNNALVTSDGHFLYGSDGHKLFAKKE
jgi:hypothetical protein